MDELRTLIIKWAQAVGKEVAEGRLRVGGLGETTARLLCAGKYDHKLTRPIRNVIIQVLAEDGFTLENGQAS